MEIRPATPDDAPALAALNAGVQQLHRDAAPTWFKPPDRAAAEDYFRVLLRSGVFHALVAEIGGRPLGYALIRVRDVPETALTYGARVVELDQIGVDAAHQGKGIGRALIEAVRTFSTEQRADRVQLTVWDFNGRARRVFERAGFAPTTSGLVSEAAPSAGPGR